MNRLRFVLLGMLARLLQRWATAVATRLETVSSQNLDSAQPDAFPGRPPEHWLEAARPTPPEHWLEVVREGAPQLLADDGDSVIDWQADDLASFSAPSAPAEHYEDAETVWDERPLPLPETPRRVYAPPAPARPLRLIGVRTGQRAQPQSPREVVSRPRAAAKLNVHARGGERGQPVGLREVRQSPGSIPAHLEGDRADTRAADLAQRPGLRSVKSRASEQAQRRPWWQASAPGPVRRLALRLVRSTLASEPQPESVGVAAQRPPLSVIQTHDLPAAGVRVASHRFPALLDDTREAPTTDMRDFERRRRLDAEQEGRTWNA